MLISLNWLRRYVDVNVPVKELCDKMELSGFEVESVEDMADRMSRVVVGRIVKIEPHPDSDHLQICQVDVGEAEPVQIITGAQNVFEGAYVPAALDDSHLPNGTHIKAGKLRGLPSNGMLCSGGELMLTEADYPGASVNGIMILHDAPAPGTDMRSILHMDDVLIDFSVTPNRPDCQSVLGLAREAAVALNKPLRTPQTGYHTAGGDIRDNISVEVRDYDLCPRYLGRVVKNLRIAPSPAWMQECLRAAGMRPINNIVDITNFVMLETGQPMHAFNLDRIAGHAIVVRRANAGEVMTTLDDKPHTLTGDMLVIADAEKPSCIAGIMGGLESEIEDDTKNLFLEAAKFRRDSVRRTSRALGMRTEASARFERGVDITGVEYAMERALSLIEELDAGDIVDGAIDRYETLPQPRELSVTAESVSALLGVDVPGETMADILNRLEIPTEYDGKTLHCHIPTRRDDMEGRADIAEEVIRVYGYDHVKATRMRGEVRRGTLLPERIKSDRVKRLLTAASLREIVTYSFISGKALDALNLPQEDPRRRMITLLNPLGEEYSAMRTQLVTNMLTVLATNYNRRNDACRFFELSKVFIPKALPLTEQPEERPALCIGLYGEEEDFFTLKGLVEQLMAAFGCRVDYRVSAEPYLHPGRQAEAVLYDGSRVAVFGELHPDTAQSYGFGCRVYTAEVALDVLFAVPEKRVIYKPLPRFPAVERDLALLCDDDMPVAQIEAVIRKAGGRTLESVRLFDVYRGAQILAGKKSVAYSLTFRAADKTLTDADIDPAVRNICAALEEKGCLLRT